MRRSGTAKSRGVRLHGVESDCRPSRRREADAPGGGLDGRVGSGVGASYACSFKASGKRAPRGRNLSYCITGFLWRFGSKMRVYIVVKCIIGRGRAPYGDLNFFSVGLLSYFEVLKQLTFYQPVPGIYDTDKRYLV